MHDWHLLLTDANIATMRAGAPDYGVIEDGAVAIANGHIEWIGARAELPAGTAAETRELGGRWLTPAPICTRPGPWQRGICFVTTCRHRSWLPARCERPWMRLASSPVTSHRMMSSGASLRRSASASERAASAPA